jgi:hypothetical protein
MPKIRKTTSKRTTLKKKYSIQKKIKDSKKKIKKEAKKLKAMGIAPKSKLNLSIIDCRIEERSRHSKHIPIQRGTP